MCIFVFISLSLSYCHYYIPHYYKIIIHYFSTFPALPFFFGYLSFVPYYCPTTNKYSTNSFYFSSFTFLLGHPSFVPYYCPTTNKYSLQTLSLSLSLSLLQLYSQLTSHSLRHLSTIFQFLNNIIHIFTHFFTYTYFQKSKSNVTRTTLPNGLVVAKKIKIK